jgi:hypothetical protein
MVVSVMCKGHHGLKKKAILGSWSWSYCLTRGVLGRTWGCRVARVGAN